MERSQHWWRPDVYEAFRKAIVEVPATGTAIAA